MSETPRQVEQLVDPGTFEPHLDDLISRDPLTYPGYRDALSGASEKAGTDESVSTGRARINGHEVELAVFNFLFMGGSMGEVTGERLARAMERAADRGVPFVLRTETGGARMQEGMRSLIQMPKAVTARMTLGEAHQPFIALLGHPTTGGVFAGLAALADVALAERGATVGFAGPRVAERATGGPLLPGSHTADFAFEHGTVDAVVPGEEAAASIGRLLDCLAADDPLAATEAPVEATGQQRPDPWDAVQAARGARDPSEDAWDLRWELSGDRAGGRAPQLATALVRIGGRRALVLEMTGHLLGPSAYRMALRCADLAARLRLPLISLVDTRGADPSSASEGQGIAMLIAQLTEKMLSAPVPVLSILTGEGGSGGALSFATADVLLAYETSIFSVIGPEAAAEILWRDASRAPEAARTLKLTAHDLRELGIADGVLAGAPDAASLRRAVTYHLERMPVGDNLSRRRRDRWRKTW